MAVGPDSYDCRVQLPRPSRQTMRRLAAGTVVANVAIIVTGGAVRLTGSGLGCPTWPQCTPGSFVPHDALGVHGAIEFSNRMITFAVAIVVVLAWLAALLDQPRQHGVVVRATLLAIGVPAQAVMGGITVLTDLDPWVVGAHFMLSPVLVALAVSFARRVDEPDTPAVQTVPRPVRALAVATFAAAYAVLYAGTIVTGSGPHAGDASAPRNGFDPAVTAQLHADLVFLLVGLTVGVLLAFRGVAAPVRAQRAAVFLLCCEVGQGLVGFTQYATDLPILLVNVHLLGAAVTVAGAAWIVVGTRERLPYPAAGDPNPLPDRRRSDPAHAVGSAG